MTRMLTACCLLALAALAAHAAPQDHLDRVNVDEVLANDRLLKAYLQCVLDAGDSKCTTEGKELKKMLPSLVATGCGHCTPRQLERSIKVLKHVTVKRPQEWARLKAKYDPTGEHTKRHAATWKQRGVDF